MVDRLLKRLVRHGFALAALLLPIAPLRAQLIGDNIRGDVGLKSGSQPGAGVYLALPGFYRADYKGIRDKQGDTFADGLKTNINFLIAPGLFVVTNWKVLGANYGAMVLIPYSNTRVEIAAADVTRGGSYGFTDMFVQPISLGWHVPGADYSFGYLLFLPTGGEGHTLDQVGHEISGGTTQYFGKDRLWNFAATAYFDIYQKKQNKDLRTGDILTVEGGLGRSFFKGVANAGIAYVAQWKVTDDGGSAFPPAIPKTKYQVYGLGPELDMPLYGKPPFAMLLTARYIWEFGGRSTFEGNDFMIGLTLAHLGFP